MKKSIYYLLAALPSLLLTASCSQDELGAASGSGQECIVTFNVTQPDGVQTRSFGDGKTAKYLKYAVYDSDGKLNEGLSKKDDAITLDENLSATVSITLLRGNSYSVIFWADAGNASPYTVDWTNKKMTMKTSTTDTPIPVANSENYDAFYKKVEIASVDGNVTEVVELKRPFAQLNIGTNDLDEAKTLGFEVTQTKVTVKDLATTLDLTNGNVSGSAETTFDYAAIPTKDANNAFPVTAEQGANSYEYLSVCYLLVGAEQGTMDVTLTVSIRNCPTFLNNYCLLPLPSKKTCSI